jgi:hypothetical protein
MVSGRVMKINKPNRYQNLAQLLITNAPLLPQLAEDASLFRFAPISDEMILNYFAVHELEMPRGY